MSSPFDRQEVERHRSQEDDDDDDHFLPSAEDLDAYVEEQNIARATSFDDGGCEECDGSGSVINRITGDVINCQTCVSRTVREYWRKREEEEES